MRALSRYFSAYAILSVAAILIVPVATLLTALVVPGRADDRPGPA
jgi:hypothetical protein